MNRVAVDLSWYQRLKRRLSLCRNRWHEYQEGLCCPVMLMGGTVQHRDSAWCDCDTATQRREIAHRRRVDAGGYVPVTALGPPPLGQPAFVKTEVPPAPGSDTFDPFLCDARGTSRPR